MDIVITVFYLILLVLLTVMLVKILFNGVESINKLAEKHHEKNSVKNKLEKEEIDEVMEHNNIADNINIYNIEAENVKTPAKENKVKGKITAYFYKAASSINKNIIRKVKKNIIKFINDAEYYASKADSEADNQEYIDVRFMKNQALSDEYDLNTDNSLYSHLKNKYNKYMPYSNIDLKCWQMIKI